MKCSRTHITSDTFYGCMLQCDILLVVCLIIYARVVGTTSSLRAFKLQYVLTFNILYVVADVEN